jgi:hypothetical protein
MSAETEAGDGAEGEGVLAGEEGIQANRIEHRTERPADARSRSCLYVTE